MIKEKYSITGFDCANCCLNAERHLNQNADIESCSIDFMNKKMVINFKNKELSIDQIKKIIKEVEEDDITIEKLSDLKSVKKKNKIIDKKSINSLIRISISLIIVLVTFFSIQKYIEPKIGEPLWFLMLILYLISYFIISYDYFIKFFKNIRKLSNLLNETTLMLIASIGAFAIQEYFEGVLVILLSQIGEIIENMSLNKSKNTIVDAIDIRSNTADVLINGELQTIDVENIKIGDVLQIKVGEVLPVDGKIYEGEGLVDESAITGEFIPRKVKKDSQLYSGSILKEGSIKMAATSTYKNSSTSKILDMVIESGEHKSKAESFISKFARIYTPIVVCLALIAASLIPSIICLINHAFTWDIYKQWIHISLTLLVISCPCAIVISVPLAYFSGIALAAKNGIVIKGSNYLDRLNDLRYMVFDKTGTLTTGEFSIVKEVNINIDLNEFRKFFYLGELLSNHPIGKCIVKTYNLGFDSKDIQNYNEIAGHGVDYDYEGKHIILCNESYLKENNISFVEAKEKLSVVYLVIDNICHGYITLDDSPKLNSKKTIDILNKNNIKTIILSGAKKESADYMGNLLGVKEIYSELLPQDKIAHLKSFIEKKDGAVGFVGDGINDSPSIILSDVGFAMGSLGSDAAVENADVVIMNDDPIKVIESIKIARASRYRAIEDIVIALLIKLTIMILAFIPCINLPMYVAVLADTGLAVLLVLFSLSLVLKKIKVH